MSRRAFPMRRDAGAPSDSGAALVTVIVMLAVMAVLAVAAMEAARFSIRRMDNQRQIDQARWYLLGAERFASARASDLASAAASGAVMTGWQGKPFTFPIEGGAITFTLNDGSNCFNLNNTVTVGENGELIGNPSGQIILARLLTQGSAQVFNAQALAATLTDYLDTDRIASPGGVEDQLGGSPAQSYHTANTLIGDVSELLSVRGFSQEIVAALAPHVCVRDNSAFGALNVNSLTREDAPLLSAIFGETIGLSAAQAIIAARPLDGWPDLDAFFADPRFGALEVDEGLRALFTVRPRFLVMTARVIWQDVDEASAALIEVGPPSRVVRRVFGAQVSERSV